MRCFHEARNTDGDYDPMNRVDQMRQFEADNLLAALRILADADRYGGDNSLAIIWARAVLARQSYLPLTYGTETKAA